MEIHSNALHKARNSLNLGSDNLLKSGQSTFNRDLIISGITIQYPQIKIFNIQIQIRKYKLQSPKTKPSY